MSFTPGPWDFSWEIQPNGCPTVGHKGLMVCMVAHSAKDPEQKETALANASLIAAAPELLEALEEALLKMESDEERIEGEWGSCRSLEQLEKDGELDDAILKARAIIAKARGEGV